MKARSPEPYCIICRSRDVRLHYYPPNLFNGKAFRYYRCRRCGSLSICPLPDEADFRFVREFMCFIDVAPWSEAEETRRVFLDAFSLPNGR